MIQFDTFAERYQYLVLSGDVGARTFGSDRYLNQAFYKSREWRLVRDEVIARDMGCDLGVPGYDIHDKRDAYVHHMNPMVVHDLIEGNHDIMDSRFLITVTHRTHNAIHYGDEAHVPRQLVERRPNDTTPWR